MKKFFVLIMAASCLFASCNPKDEKDNDGEEKTTKTKDNDDDDSKAKDESDDFAKVATGVCNCMSSAVDGFSAKGKRMLIKAGNSDNPTQTLQDEMMSIEDEEEKQKLGREFQTLAAIDQDTDMKECMEKLKKKYDLDDNDKKSQQKIVNALEDKDDCEVVTALMKIGMKEQKRNTPEE